MTERGRKHWDPRENPIHDAIRRQWNIPGLVKDLRERQFEALESNRIHRMVWIASYPAFEKLVRETIPDDEWTKATDEGYEHEYVDEYMDAMGALIIATIGDSGPSEGVYVSADEGEVFLGQIEDMSLEDWLGPSAEASSLSGARMGAIEGWVVTQDGETLAYGFYDDGEAMAWLHRHQGQSVDYAVRHGGYDIVLVENRKVTWSYKRDILPQTTEMGAVELIELGDGMPEDFYAEYELGAKVKKRTPFAKAKKTAAKVERWLNPFAQRLLLAGSIRRKRPEIGDIEFVILPKKSVGVEGLAEKLEELGFSVGPTIRSAKQMVDGIKVEIYIVHHPNEFGAMSFMYTGDRTFNFAMRKKAMAMGYLLNQYGIWTRDKSRAILQSPDEKDFFEFLKVSYHTPEERSLKHRTPEERRRAKARQARMKGVMSGDEEVFFTRLESVWGEPVGEES